MDVVWDAEGPVTPRRAHDELRRTRKLAYTTAMTIHSYVARSPTTR
jgi:hypothetical protein